MDNLSPSFGIGFVAGLRSMTACAALTWAASFGKAFNRRLRAECLNASRFLSLADAQARLEAWRQEYDEERPHGPLRNLTPRAFAEQA